MSEFREADKQAAGMHGYEPMDRTCDRCGETIVGPALFRAGKTKGELLCGTCKEQA